MRKRKPTGLDPLPWGGSKLTHHLSNPGLGSGTRRQAPLPSEKCLEIDRKSRETQSLLVRNFHMITY